MIPDYIRRNFQTMLRAADDGALALMEGKDAVTGEVRYILVAANPPSSDGSITFTPFGHLSAGNPYEEYVPPTDETEEAA